MLISFSVENFRSIRDLQTFSLEEQRSDEHLRESNTFEAGKRRLLKSAAIFGPNASGKSNVLNALGWMRLFITTSHMFPPGGKIGHMPFRLSTVTENAPTHFEVEFFHDGHEYRYGFELVAEHIVSEWLFRKQPDAKPACLFTREGAQIERSTEHFKEGKGLEERTRPDVLFLSVCAQFNGAESGKVMRWFLKLLVTSGLQDDFMPLTIQHLADSKHQPALAAFIRNAGLGIPNLKVAEENQVELTLPSNLPAGSSVRLSMTASGQKQQRIKTLHDKRDDKGSVVGSVEFDLTKDESHGTQKYVALSAPILAAFQQGYILVIDEIDARLHPLLTQTLFDRFHSAENKANAQLICAAHDVTLLEPERFRRDQIWFCEKDENEATELYSLAEFDPQDVRPTTKFSRQYLKGLFGAVPRLAQFREDLQHV